VVFLKAARLHKIGEDLKLDEVEVPSLADDQVLLKVRASGICHSDINYRDGVGKVGRLPITLGHEVSGIVAERGSKVEQVARDERV